jgi:hypothetical protein
MTELFRAPEKYLYVLIRQLYNTKASELWIWISASHNIQSISRQGRIQEKKNQRIENVTSIVVIQVQSN